MLHKNNQLLYERIIFDCDSTLSTIEGIDYLAEIAGKGSEVADLTSKAMNGEVKFEDVFAKRLDIIQPRKEQLQMVGQKYIETVIPDAHNTIDVLQKNEVEVYIISGGYTQAILPLAKFLGINEKNVFAVDLAFNEDGSYQGFDSSNPLTKSGGKLEVAKQIDNGKKTIFVGDSITDVEASEAVDLFVGFGGVVERDVVKEKSDVYISNNSFAYILNVILGEKYQGLNKLGVLFS